MDEGKQNTITTFNITYDSFDQCYIIVCPECGEYIYYKKGWPNACHCGFYWRVKSVAIGKKK